MEISKKQTITFLLICVGIIGGIYGSTVIWAYAAGVKGSPIIVVSSESMMPALKVGDIAIIAMKNPEDIVNGTVEDKTGDIVVFDPRGIWNDARVQQLNGQNVIHRVVGKYYNDIDNKYYFITKGDNNTIIDIGVVPEDHICGVVQYIIPYVGMLKVWLSNPLIFFPLIFIIVGLTIASWWYDLKHPQECDPKVEDCANASR